VRALLQSSLLRPENALFEPESSLLTDGKSLLRFTGICANRRTITSIITKNSTALWRPSTWSEIIPWTREFAAIVGRHPR